MTTVGSKKITSVALVALLATATALGAGSLSWADPGHGRSISDSQEALLK